MKEIVLAGGCFWGVEHFFKQFDGIADTEVGYVNSRIPHPTYEQVCAGITGATEGVLVQYDPEKIHLEQILDAFFAIIDPTSLNRQGNDVGTNYRTGIYYTNEIQKEVCETQLQDLQAHLDRPVMIELLPLKNFWPAEGYHQDYLEKHPGGYCHIPAVKMQGYTLLPVVKEEKDQ